MHHETTGNQLLTTLHIDTRDVEWLLKWLIVVLLKTLGTCAGFRAKSVHISGYLPTA